MGHCTHAHRMRSPVHGLCPLAFALGGLCSTWPRKDTKKRLAEPYAACGLHCEQCEAANAVNEVCSENPNEATQADASSNECEAVAFEGSKCERQGRQRGRWSRRSQSAPCVEGW